MKKLILSISALLMLVSVVDAQQLHRRTQFLFNTYLVNPAVAGTQTYSPIMASYRNQWTGFDHAPSTYTLSGHTQLPNKVGVGGILFHDDTGGAISRTGAEITGTYSFDLNNQDAVSFGLSLVGSQYSFDNESLLVYDLNDLALQGGMESQFNIDANFGMMVYGVNYFFGFAFPQIIQSKLKLDSSVNPNDNRNARHYYFMGAYQYYITNELNIQPSALIKFTGASPVQFDVNAKLTYKDFIWAGLTYRHKDAVAFTSGVIYSNWTLGYSYDLTTTDARSFSPHTHEISLGYYIPRGRAGFSSKSLLGPKILDRGRIVN
ncbi:MAG: type IX secretion system membrane protein PorP/SprF [Flavobacteriales bacterium]|nr:type IX secretion system membrane protein PorP/SprF [Flavobacteriales bacterium]